MHWVCFYGSIKLGNSASITLACLGLVSFFLSLLEPYIMDTKFNYRNIFLGSIIVIGVLFIYLSLPSDNNSSLSLSMIENKPNEKAAIIIGILAALTASLITIYNKKYINDASVIAISTIEVGTGCILLTILVPIYHGNNTKFYPSLDINNGNYDLLWVLLLSILCTNLTFIMNIWCISKLSAFTIVLAANLEPVYGILFII